MDLGENFLNRVIDELVRLFDLIRITKERPTGADSLVQLENG